MVCDWPHDRKVGTLPEHDADCVFRDKRQAKEISLSFYNGCLTYITEILRFWKLISELKEKGQRENAGVITVMKTEGKYK